MYEETLTTAERISLHDSYNQLGNTAMREATISLPKDVSYNSGYPFRAEAPIDVNITPHDDFVMLSLQQQDGPAHISHSYTLPRDPAAHGMVDEGRTFGDYDSQAGHNIIRAERHALLDHIRLELAARLIMHELALAAREPADASI